MWKTLHFNLFVAKKNIDGNAKEILSISITKRIC